MAYGARIDSNTLTNLQGGVLSSDAQSLQAEQAFAAAKQSGGGPNSITQYT